MDTMLDTRCRSGGGKQITGVTQRQYLWLVHAHPMNTMLDTRCMGVKEFSRWQRVYRDANLQLGWIALVPTAAVNLSRSAHVPALSVQLPCHFSLPLAATEDKEKRT